MFCKRNRKVRKYTVGRVTKQRGVDFFYVVPVAKSKKGSKLAIIDLRDGVEKKITLSGREVLQLRRVLAKGQQLMRKK
jgi:hypothetical protein